MTRRQPLYHHYHVAAVCGMPAGMGTEKTAWARGKIIDTNGRSYIITAENGATYRRNRVQIRPDLTNGNQADDTDDDDDDEATTRSRPQHKQPNTARCNQGHGFVPPVRSRSGRIIKSVVRQDTSRGALTLTRKTLIWLCMYLSMYPGSM